MDLISNFWDLFVLSAPWLLLGLFLAGVLNVYLPSHILQRHLGQEGFWTTVKAALIGAPMPLCSCGVIPAAVGLRRAGASKSATTSFLVSTPETGVDSVSVSYALLGPFMAIIRPIAAVCSAIAAGVLVGKEGGTAHQHHSSSSLSSTSSPCCASEQQLSHPQVESSCCDTHATPIETHACCSTSTSTSTQGKNKDTDEHGAMTKLTQALQFSATKLLSDTALWLMVGLFFAALVHTYVPASYLSQWGSGLLAMTVMVIISIPMYICATASTPIAAGLLLAGVSPGSVLVFMLAGPATNVATLGVVGKELGRRALFAYLIGVIGVALLFGYLTDYLVSEFDVQVVALTSYHESVLPSWLATGSALLLVVLMLRLVWLKIQSLWLPSTGKSC
ncbi:SO_0444 family Cu/Zn efflux transporter [Pseudoalteromonas sp. SSDWG2]|uniref:SO_0444 family Cu/Zn efflux transporter n=1 Tax=Pseudoalteromonas sp. SSDWG2 TaxID=3139391 RepID=UPI003BA92097